MGKHGDGQRLDIIGHDIVASRDQGQALRGTIKGQGPAGADADVQFFPLAGRVDDIEQVFGDRIVNADLPDRQLEPSDILPGDDRSERFHGFAVAVGDQDARSSERTGSPSGAGS